MKKSLILAFSALMGLGVCATHAGPPADVMSGAAPGGEEPALLATEAGEAGETSSGSCSNCSGWVWQRPEECWRYVSGSEERIWVYFIASPPSYAVVDTGDARHLQFIEACGNYHYLGTYWESSNTFSNVRLWYN
jgi:hypothetical protein